MKNRRSFLLSLIAGLVALALIITPVIAEEFFGFITKVDVEGKKLTVVTKEDQEIEITTNDDTELVTAKGTNKLGPGALEKLSSGVAKYKDAGAKGIPAKIAHENKVASKVTVIQKKKAAN